MKKRLLSIALCLCMLLTLLPSVALADDTFVPTEQELIDAETYQAAFAQEKTWENLGNAALNYNYAKTYVANLEDGETKTAAQARLDALTEYYEGITELDMSGKKGGYGGDDGRHGCLTILTNLEKLNLSDTGITNVGPLQSLTKLQELDISNNPISDLGALAGLTELTKLDASNTDLDSNDFGPLVGKNLTWLDLSGTDITSIGPITTNGGNPNCAQTLTYLDVSNTGLTQLQEVWNGTSQSASLPALKTLNAKGLSLTSISGLAEIVNASGFSADGITWDLSGSTLSADTDNHIALISGKLSSGFTAPVVKDTPEYALVKAEQWETTIDEQLGSDNGKAALTWKSLIFGNYWFNQAKNQIDDMTEGEDKTALQTRWNAIDTYYKSITAIDMSGKTEVPDGYAKSMGVFNIFPNLTKLDVSNTGLSDFGIGTGGAGLVNLEELNLSGLTCDTENTLFGGLEGLNNLKVLDISDIEEVTDIGGLVNAGVADTITTLDISNTGVTKLESIWNKDDSKSNFPALTTLTAHGLTLESISGLAEIVNADDFNADGITWDFGTDDTQSTVTDDGSSLAPVHVVMIRLAFADAGTGTFNAPETGANAAYSAIRYQKNITKSLTEGGSDSLSWDTVITAKYWRTTAESYIDSLSVGTAKTALANLMADVDAEYAKITELDMSGKTESQYAISTDAVNLFPNLTTLNLSGTGISDTGGLAPLTELQSLDLSDNAGITDANLGALSGMTDLAILNLSGTGITDIGGLVANGVADTITTLDISDTKVTKLESIWDAVNKTSAFPALTTLTARGLALESISGLAEIANADGFSADGITWDLGGSTLSADADNHIAQISSKLPSGFTAPVVKDTPEYALVKAEQWKATIDEQLGSDNGKAALTWKSLIFGHYWFDTAKAEIDSMSDGADKTALQTRWDAIDTYYKSITAIDMSGKTEVPDGYAKSMGVFSIFPNLTKLDVSDTGLSDFGIGIDGAGLVNLEELNLSGLTCDPNDTLFGGLKGLDKLKVLDISDIEGVTDIGGLVDAGVADTITTLNISNTGVTKLESIWDAVNKVSAFPELTTLTAQNLQLTSISGLVEIVSKEGFDATGITWNLDGSTLTDSSQNQEHIATITAKLGAAFTAPTISSTPIVPPEPGDDGDSGSGDSGDSGDSGSGDSGSGDSGSGDSGSGDSGNGGGGNSSGGSSTPSYSTTVEKTENGSVTVSPQNASKGTVVTVTVKPDNGFVLDTLTVSDSNGSKLALTDKGNGQYTFIMPTSAVTVKATFAAVSVPLPFADINTGDWFYDAVKYVYDNDMMNGMGNNSFAPNTTLSRGMIAQVLYNLEKNPAAGSSAFTDVASGAWYTDAVNWAAANGIVAGYGDGTFAPNKDITRQEMATILYRYAKYKGYDTTQSGMAINEFADADKIGDWAMDAMSWAVATGLLNGRGANMLQPTGTATRAEVATILMRFCENIAK